MSEIEGYACDRNGMLMPARCRSSNGEECMCWPKIAKPAEPAGDRIVNGFVILDGMAFSKEEILTQRIALCDALDAAGKLTAERDGANERAGLLLKAKDEWAERARAAEAERDRMRAVLEGAQYQNIDQLKTQSVERCRQVGENVMRLTVGALSERDQLRAEVERLRSVCADLDSEKREIEHKMDAYRASHAEVEALRKDAERYRLLRRVTIEVHEAHDGSDAEFDAEFDFAIDAALAAKEGV